MYLMNWGPFTSRKARECDITPYERYLGIRATLRCPVCAARNRFTTQTYPFVFGFIRGRWVLARDEIVNYLSMCFLDPDEEDGIGPCKHCGAPSRLPEADFKRLCKEMRAQITVRWLEKACRMDVRLKRAG